MWSSTIEASFPTAGQGLAGMACNSYAEEGVAIRALDWLEEGEEWSTAVIATDSRFLLDGLRGHREDLGP